MSGECQVNVKSQSELDIGGRETCYYNFHVISKKKQHENKNRKSFQTLNDKSVKTIFSIPVSSIIESGSGEMRIILNK